MHLSAKKAVILFFSIDHPREGYGIISVPKHNELDPVLRDGIIASISMHTGISEDDIVDMLR